VVQNGIRRNTEIEEATNLYLIHPVSSWLVPLFAKAGVHPNVVSIAGALCGMAAGVVYFFYDRPGFTYYGLALMLAWHILDGADGQLARLTNKSSTLGFVIDGTCDYLAFGAIYISIALKVSQTQGPGIWLLVLGAAASHAVQAAAFERQREAYIYWTSKIFTPATAANDTSAAKFAAARGLMAYYDWVQRPFMVMNPEQEERLRGQVARGKAAEVAAIYRTLYRPAVMMWSLLSANNRTIIIFLAFLAGRPDGYPWFELVVLNVALLAFVAMNASLGRRLAVRSAAA
jgi:phosphatidylglycerophosphate synthase